MRFRVLGTVEIAVDGVPVAGTAPRHRAVLAYLLLNAGQLVSAERIIDAMWGPTPPDTARAQIHAAVTAIRRALRSVQVEGLLETKSAAGYVVRPGLGDFDLAEFDALVALGHARATDDPRGAAQALRTALGLWRGEALADVAADYVAGTRARLGEKRIATIERLIEVELTLGRHRDIIDELADHAVANPLRERLHAQLVLALYRSGRQADALGAARTFRAQLAERQGLDPGRAFLALEQAVLRDDPSLALPEQRSPNTDHTPEPPRSDNAPKTIDGPPVASDRTGAAHRRQTPPTSPPNFLPYDIPDFAGRVAELDQLTAPRTDDTRAPNVVVLDGMAGIGKTTLAVHTAHRMTDRFPDGGLFIDLQGHTPGSRPIDPGAALELLLRQLGIPADRIPMPDADRGAMWRAELATRALVVVLDNAVDAEQIWPLLPGASPSLLLITSRRRLLDLDGAQAISLDLLSSVDAIALFGRIVGERAAAEPQDVLDVLRLCGFLPLAVRIAAARLHHRPRWSVAYLASRLRDQQHRLAELSTADRGVAAAFALSYEYLTPDQQRVFRLLGLHPGRDIDPRATAALADISDRAAEEHLEELLDAHMSAQHEPGRYTQHDLLREFARATAAATEPLADREAATTRLFEHYLYHARAAVDLLYPYNTDARTPLPEPTRPIAPFRDTAAAAAWLAAERANLVSTTATAAHCAWPLRVSDLADTLRVYLDGNSRHSDAAILHEAALQAARRAHDRDAEGRALTDLGWTAWRRGDYPVAEELSRQAVELCGATGMDREEARAWNTLGNVAARRRGFESAREYYAKALELAHGSDNRVGQAHVLGNLGVILDLCGLPADADDHLNRALTLHRELGNRHGEALVLNYIGLVHRRGGNLEQAMRHHRQSAELYAAQNNHSDRAAALNGLGETARAAGDRAGALDEHAAALRLAEENGNQPERARAAEGLARAHRDLGNLDLARHHAEQALTGWSTLRVPEADDVRAFLEELG
ncbi:BTAD domain-containing putative transcriptional regulator [Nocardia sp. NPDC050710]|uniref:AfsR/SARP family transcriptional regulator n=1 Tax=Nocardia sp. NPDC050710 TaxID=3157220 RepID=UPI0033E5DBE7